MGAKASLLVGDLVTIRADQLPGFVGEDRPYLHSVARSDAPPVEVNAALSAPSEVNPCIPIRLSSELSTGDSGRGSAGSSSHAFFKCSIQSIIDFVDLLPVMFYRCVCNKRVRQHAGRMATGQHHWSQ